MADLYFAYGSNLDREQMAERCPESNPLFVAVLRDFKLGFTIYSPKRGGAAADIVRAEGSSVWGGVYSVTESDLQALDVCERCPTGYERVRVSVIGVDFVPHEVWTYQVVNKKENLEPTHGYLEKIRLGAADWGLPSAYQAMLNELEHEEDEDH